MTDRPSESTEYHTRLMKAALAVDDCRAYWQGRRTKLQPTPEIAFQEYWFGARSLPWLQRLLGDMRARFEAYPESLAVLSAWTSMSVSVRLSICHWHLQLADPLYRNFTGQFLPERVANGFESVRKSIVAEWIEKCCPDRWQLVTRNQFARKLLYAAADAGFGKQRLDLSWTKLQYPLAKQLVAAVAGLAPSKLRKADVEKTLVSRGLLWQSPDDGKSYTTAAAMLLLSDDPSSQFPQCRILADAYNGTERISKPDDQEEIREALPSAIDRALKFVDRNTRHPMRVVGLNRIRLDEYPTEALREALVNAVAHRRYEQEGQKIQLEVFSDRVVISSPGILPKPLTLTKIRKGNYRAISRNPLIAHGLSFFHRIEERGSGFGRMKEMMKDHGLDQPLLSTNSGCFEITFPGPGDDIDRLRVPDEFARPKIEPAIEANLNDRQRQVMNEVHINNSVTTGWCREQFGVAYDTAQRDLRELIEIGLLQQTGRGRGTKYVRVPE